MRGDEGESTWDVALATVSFIWVTPSADTEEAGKGDLVHHLARLVVGPVTPAQPE
jgi:hypothetical protein